MTGEGWAAIILALGTFVGVVTNTIVTIVNLRKSTGNSVKLDEVHKLTNSLSERAQVQAREAGNAEGELRGRLAVAAEAGADALARERGLPPRLGEP